MLNKNSLAIKEYDTKGMFSSTTPYAQTSASVTSSLSGTRSASSWRSLQAMVRYSSSFLLVTFIQMCGNLETLHVQKSLDGMGKFLQLFALSSTQISIATHHIQANFIELLLQNSLLIAIFLMSILLSSVVICIFNILFDISEMKQNAKHSRK